VPEQLGHERLAEAHDFQVAFAFGVEVDALWGLVGRQNLLVRKLTHRRDTLEEIFLKAMGHLAHTPGEAQAPVEGPLESGPVT
jgi:hypothetical protein